MIELVIVIAIVAILAAIALPSFSNSLRNNRVGTQTNDLLSAFNFARNEAITRSRGVSICAADPETDPLVCGADTAWNLGWIVVTDTAPGNAAPVVDEVLRSWVANPNNTLVPAG
ncbi:MAG: GspH/FimT family protein, partial [Dokdonella sp.]